MTTDIYGTLGPACADTEILEKMFEAGMSGIRLNLSHVTLRKAAAQVEALHKAAEKCGIKPKLLIDEIGLNAKFKGEKLFTVVIKYVAPICIVLILISSVLDVLGIVKI